MVDKHIREARALIAKVKKGKMKSPKTPLLPMPPSSLEKIIQTQYQADVFMKLLRSL